jgi:hypothetical protein
VVRSMHRQDRFLIAQANQQVAALAGFEAAALFFKPPLELPAGHHSIQRQITAKVNTSVALIGYLVAEARPGLGLEYILAMSQTRKDSQVTVLRGQHRLVDQLLQAGIEVALPIRDRGVDLIAYIDRTSKFAAVPIQLKASSKRSIGLDQKYAQCPGLLLAYIWKIDLHDSTTFAMTCPEAMAIARAMGWTKTRAWENDGRYTNNSPGRKLCKMLEKHRMNAARWNSKVIEASHQLRCRTAPGPAPFRRMRTQYYAYVFNSSYAPLKSSTCPCSNRHSRVATSSIKS